MLDPNKYIIFLAAAAAATTVLLLLYTYTELQNVEYFHLSEYTR